MGLKIQQEKDFTLLQLEYDSLDALAAREIAAASDQLQVRGVLDFGSVLFINSGGISALLKLVVEGRKQGKQLYAINVSAHHRKIFEMVNMLPYLPITELDELVTLNKA